jgi:hypothetical protein
VGGIAAAASPSAFYSGSPSAPSFPPTSTRVPPSPIPEASIASPFATPALVDVVAKLSESVALIHTQFANQAAINKSFEDKLARITHQLDRVTKGPHGKGPSPRGPRTPPPTCTYCGKIGHSVSGCFAKRDADAKATTPRPPTTYAATVSAPDASTIHYEAFLAVHHASKEALEAPSLPVLLESRDSPSLIDIPSCGDDFSDPSTAIRYLGLCSGASTQILRSLVHQGRFIAEIYLCDRDPLARRMALAALQQPVVD